MKMVRHIVCFLVLVLLAGTQQSSGAQSSIVEVRTMMGRGRFSDALDCVKTLMDGSEDEQLYDLLVEAGQYAGELDDVASYLHDRIRKGQGVAQAVSALGKLSMYRSQWGEALDRFERSVTLGNCSAKTYAGLQTSYEKLYGIEDAISHLLALTHTREKNGGIWYALALAYWSQWDLDHALSAVDQSLAVGMKDPRVVQLRAGILCSLKPHARHRSLATHVLSSAIDAGDMDGEAFMRWVLMNALEASGSHDSSTAVKEESLRLVRDRGQYRWLAQFILEDARSQLAKGRSDQALAKADTATSLFERAGIHDGVLAAHSLSMSILLESGCYEEGLEYCFRILGQLDGHSDPRLQAGASIDAAWIFSRIGAQRVALILGIQAENILEKNSYLAHDNARLSATLGSIHSALGDSSLSRRYLFSALRTVSGSGRRDQLRASCEGSIGDLLVAQGDTVQARIHFMRQWEIATEIANRGEQKSAALSLARTLDVLRDPSGTERWARIALQLSLLAGDRSSERDCRLLLGRVAEKRRVFTVAHQEYRSALRCLEAVRPLRHTCALMRETREWYIDQHCETIQALVRVGEIEDAVRALERAREDVDLGTDGTRDAGPTFLSREFLRQRRLASSLLHRWVFSTSLDRVAYSDRALRELGEYFVRVSPAIAPIPQETARSGYGFPDGRLRPAVNARIPADLVVFDMIPGQESTEVFTLTSDTIVHRTIKSGKSWWTKMKETLARRGSSASGFSELTTGRGQDDLYTQLGDTLLCGVKELILRRTRFVVVGDGFQSMLPFEVLPVRQEGGRVVRLVDQCAVTYQPCLGDLRTPPVRSFDRNNRVLVITDPVWRAGTSARAKDVVDEVLAGHGVPMVHADLPGGRTEAVMLGELFGSRVDVREGVQASAEGFFESVPHYPVVHISTHSAVRKRDYPEHVLFLSGSTLSNGEVGIADILSLDLSTTLVVLASCYSGRPSDVGDVESLAHAFLDAGAASVLAARWPIDDKVGVEFLREFYGGLSNGDTRASATRRAMQALRSAGYSDASVWAAFQFFGEGGILPGFEEAGDELWDRWWPSLLGTVTALSVFVALLFRRRKLLRLSQSDRKRRK